MPLASWNRRWLPSRAGEPSHAGGQKLPYWR
jgi:hypothetical protein